MKVPQSGLPDQADWEARFDVEAVLDRLEVGPDLGDVAEVGCGYGTFTVPAARRVFGRLHAHDLEADLVQYTLERVRDAGLGNVVGHVRDVLDDGLAEGPFDAVLLFHILHGRTVEPLLDQAARALAPDGEVLVYQWQDTPEPDMGPPPEVRIPAKEMVQAARRVGLEVREGPIDLAPHHVGLRLGPSGEP